MPLLTFVFMHDRNRKRTSGEVAWKRWNPPCSWRRASITPSWSCINWPLSTTTLTWVWTSHSSATHFNNSHSFTNETNSKRTGLVSYRCAISLRHTTWMSRWSPSRNWATGWPTCAAWAPPRTAWPSTCSTSSRLARKAAKRSIRCRPFAMSVYCPTCHQTLYFAVWLTVSSYLSRKTSWLVLLYHALLFKVALIISHRSLYLVRNLTFLHVSCGSSMKLCSKPIKQKPLGSELDSWLFLKCFQALWFELPMGAVEICSQMDFDWDGYIYLI